MARSAATKPSSAAAIDRDTFAAPVTDRVHTDAFDRFDGGLEDALLGSTVTNIGLVEDAVRRVREHGGEPATTAEVRQALAKG